jgi:succinate dehydrogenase / fumarate reductase, cytochrome b subunit
VFPNLTLYNAARFAGCTRQKAEFVFVSLRVRMCLTCLQRHKVIKTVNKKRPVNLDFSTIKLPITALVSITHRITGILLFGGVAALMWMLQSSLESAESFAAVKTLGSHPVCRVVLFGIVAILAYHTVMGLRHLIMDFGIGESLKGGQLGAKLALVVAIVLIGLAGVWIW